MFKCIPIFKACNRQVDYIDRRHCSLTTVPDEILRYARCLEELLLDANQIRELPRGFFKLVELRILGLSDNELQRLNSDISNFVNLIELDISRNDIEEIPESIKYCKNLRTADFSSNPIARLPDTFTQLKNLQVLSVNDISLIRLPGDVGSLSNLVSLELRENILKTLPQSLSHLVSLERLDLGANELSELPACIGHLPSLQELWLDQNELEALPPEIGELKQLQQLDLTENRLSRLPDQIAGLTNLTDLHLSQNQITELPEGIARLRRLQILKCDENRLSVLTDAIGSCDNLQELILTDNSLRFLPPSIGQLKRLYHFNVDKNLLEFIPPDIGRLTALSVLSLRDNKLVKLPNEIGELKEMTVLDVAENRLRNLPMSITHCKLNAIWLSENQAQPMLKFQADVDSIRNETFLTCYLLPQADWRSKSEECLLKAELKPEPTRRDGATRIKILDESKNDGDLYNIEDDKRKSLVQFEAGDEDEDDKPGLKRHATPHPRDMKEMKKKIMEATQAAKESKVCHRNSFDAHKLGAIDGAVIPHNPNNRQRIKEGHRPQSFKPQRDSDYVTSEENSPDHSRLSPANHPPASHTPANHKQPIPEILPNEPTYAEVDSNDTRATEVPVKRPTVLPTPRASAVLPGEEIYAKVQKDKKGSPSTPTPISDNLADTSSELYAAPEVPDRTEERNEPHSYLNLSSLNKPSVADSQGGNSTPLRDSVFERNVPEANVESLVDGDTDEEIQAPGRVGFSEDTSDTQSYDWKRKNTPHPNRNQRVSQNDSNEDRVRQIMSRMEPARLGDEEEANGLEYQNIPKARSNVPTPQASVKAQTIDDNNTMEYMNIPTKSMPHPQPRNSGQSVSKIPVADQPPDVIKYEPYEPHSAAADVRKRTQSPTVPMSAGISPDDFQSPTHEFEVIEEIYDLVINRQSGQGLGVSIAGGKGSPPYKGNDESIFISKVVDNGPSFEAGLKVGDKLLMVNQQNLVDGYHPEAVDALKRSGNRVLVKISREVMLTVGIPSTIETTLLKVNGELGFSIAGGKGSLPYKGNDESTYITKLTPNGAAVQNGKIEVGDKILKINGVDVTDASHDEVVSRLTMPQSSIALTLYREQLIRKGTGSPRKVVNGGAGEPVVIEKVTKVTKTSQYIGGDVEKTDKFKQITVESSNNRSRSPLVKPVNSSSNYEIEEVCIMKAGGPLGLSIVGGIDHASHPFGNSEPGVFISKIVPGGTAAQTSLSIGNRILTVNGRDISGATHEEAVKALIEPSYQILLKIRHDPPPPGLKELVIEREPREKIGMNIKGGAGGPPGNPADPTDEGVFISKISAEGAVARDGKLEVGKRILEVNGQSMLGATHQEAVRALRQAGNRVQIMVCDGYNLGLESATLSKSMSSLDREDDEYIRIQQENDALREEQEFEEELKRERQRREEENARLEREAVEQMEIQLRNNAEERRRQEALAREADLRKQQQEAHRRSELLRRQEEERILAAEREAAEREREAAEAEHQRQEEEERLRQAEILRYEPEGTSFGTPPPDPPSPYPSPPPALSEDVPFAEGSSSDEESGTTSAFAFGSPKSAASESKIPVAAQRVSKPAPAVPQKPVIAAKPIVASKPTVSKSGIPVAAASSPVAASSSKPPPSSRLKPPVTYRTPSVAKPAASGIDVNSQNGERIDTKKARTSFFDTAAAPPPANNPWSKYDRKKTPGASADILTYAQVKAQQAEEREMQRKQRLADMERDAKHTHAMTSQGVEGHAGPNGSEGEEGRSLTPPDSLRKLRTSSGESKIPVSVLTPRHKSSQKH
ncbi:protein scribble homolog isoform X2 [Watersipora subatra]|uniref:protein scribble homolog isoform X2 n=1 Tax=Watersipora subatra TaxID=2589382 RepID=UPI00355BBD00